MASFEAKIGWKMPRTSNGNSKKNSKNVQKIKKIPLWLPVYPK